MKHANMQRRCTMQGLRAPSDTGPAHEGRAPLTIDTQSHLYSVRPSTICLHREPARCSGAAVQQGGIAGAWCRAVQQQSSREASQVAGAERCSKSRVHRVARVQAAQAGRHRSDTLEHTSHNWSSATMPLRGVAHHLQQVAGRE